MGPSSASWSLPLAMSSSLLQTLVIYVGNVVKNPKEESTGKSDGTTHYFR